MYRARKSRTTLQNKVRLKVLPEQLTLFVNMSVTLKKMYYSIVSYNTVLIIAQKYTLFHIPVMKNIVKGLFAVINQVERTKDILLNSNDKTVMRP